MLFPICLALLCLSCSSPDREESLPSAATLLHLCDELTGASVVSAGAPVSARGERRWSLGSLRSDWRALSSDEISHLAGVKLEMREDALELSLSAPRERRGPMWIGGIAADLGKLRLDEWETVLVRARSSDRFAGVTVAYNVDEEGALPGWRTFVLSPDEAPPVFNDGSEQTYAIPLRPRAGTGPEGALRSVAVLFAAPGAAKVDLLSVTLVPRGADFLEDAGTRSVSRSGTTRHTLFAHARARLSFPVEIPPGGRLDFGLSVSRGEAVTYRVRTEGSDEVLFEETVDDPRAWHQRSVDLSKLAGSSPGLILEATSDREGAVALWGAPILSGGAQPAGRPNVIFYVIDGGGADLMSAFGYERPTTPFLEELAAEGVVFPRAHSNSTWTQPSTVSFMTSLQHSVLGGLRRGVHSTSVPTAATTLAEHFRAAGYQTASFGSNPNAGRIIGIERGMDLMRDVETGHHSTSSLELQREFWSFREAYPGLPYWVHFQTTDVHEPNEPREPFAGRFVSPDERDQLEVWDGELSAAAGGLFGTTSIAAYYDLALERAGIDRKAYFGTRRGLYDETMTHQDQALRKLVDRLKAAGEWQNTLLVIGSDHGHPAGTFARFGRGLFDPQPEPWQGALFDAYATRVPLLVVWPGHIEGGRTVDQPVSMLDVLPTLLDLAGLPAAEVAQGQSLAPLLRGGEQALRPVILDEFRVDEKTGEMVGNLEIVDGRWGASLEIAPVAEGADPSLGRHAVPAGGRWGAVHPHFAEVPRLLLYDLEQDPFARRAVNDEHPEVVAHYRAILLEQWGAHRSLAKRFGAADAPALTPAQLNQLRTLGYIQ